jgi:hypothetical protein
MWKRLFNMKIGYSTNAVDYLDKVRGVASQLQESGAIVSDEILVTVALQGLSEKFDTLVAVITHKEEPPTFDALTALLTDEVDRQGGDEGSLLLGRYSVTGSEYLAATSIIYFGRIR